MYVHLVTLLYLHLTERYYHLRTKYCITFRSTKYAVLFKFFNHLTTHTRRKKTNRKKGINAWKREKHSDETISYCN